jgi:hypothetical protein
MRLILVFGCLFLSFTVSGQGFNPGIEDSNPYPLRSFLNKFSFNLSSGYGRTFYRQDFSDLAYLRNEQGSFLINAESAEEGNTVTGLNNWFTGAGLQNNIVLDDDFSLVRFDSTDSPLRSGGYSVPINLSIYFNLYRVRFGGGASIEFHNANYTEPADFLSAYPDPAAFKTTMSRFYILLGYSVYEIYDNAFGVDIRAGRINMGQGFDNNVVVASPFVNIGITAEKVFSEYFRIYIRPSFEIKSFEVSLPANQTFEQTSLTVNNNAFNVTMGLSINYPDLPRSPIPSDKIQMKHYVSDSKGNRLLVRGQPFWKKQDPKIGELYPELIKSKRKRKARFLFFK